MIDHAIVNLPLHKRGGGSLDLQIDRAMAEQRRESREADLRYAEERKRVAALRKRIAALPDEALAADAAAAGVPIAALREAMRQMAASRPLSVEGLVGKKEAPRA